jgi:hypothetical protein
LQLSFLKLCKQTTQIPRIFYSFNCVNLNTNEFLNLIENLFAGVCAKSNILSRPLASKKTISVRFFKKTITEKNRKRKKKPHFNNKKSISMLMDYLAKRSVIGVV